MAPTLANRIRRRQSGPNEAGGRQAENDEGECRREADAERREEQRASERPRGPAAEQEEPGGDRLARRSTRVVGGAPCERREPGPTGDERHAHKVLAGDEDAAGADAEEHDQEQRPPEARGARRGRRDRKREERNRVDEAERDDRERDRLETELDAAHAAQRADLDQVVEPERQDDAACRRSAAGGQAAGAIRAGSGGKELLPAECAEDVAREVKEDGAPDIPHLRMLKRPARVGESLPEQRTGGDRDQDEAKPADKSKAPVTPARHVVGGGQHRSSGLHVFSIDHLPPNLMATRRKSPTWCEKPDASPAAAAPKEQLHLGPSVTLSGPPSRTCSGGLSDLPVHREPRPVFARTGSPRRS